MLRKLLIVGFIGTICLVAIYSHFKKGNKMRILTVAILILFALVGCAETLNKPNIRNFAAKDNKGGYGMKYHFIIETHNNISDMHNPFSTFVLTTHYHIYTDSLGSVTGDKILFAKHDNVTPRRLSNSSLFKFDKNYISIDGLKWCSDEINHCENILNGKYPLYDISKLNPENGNIDNSPYRGHFE